MKMVFKILGNFDDSSFEKKLNKLIDNFTFIYYNGSLFVSIIDFNFSEKAEDYIRKIFRPQKDYLITEVNETNINNYPEVIKEWCLSNFVKLETQRYEFNEQLKLRQTWERMDLMEKELQRMLENNKEENND